MLNKKQIRFFSVHGFVLLELIISVTIFSVLMISATTVYIRFLEQNRRTQALRQLTDQARVLAERIRNDLNTATKDTHGITLCHQGPFPRIYSQAQSDQILFVDTEGRCVGYFLAPNASADVSTIMRADDIVNNISYAALTTPSVNVTALRFTIYESQFLDQHPAVDIFFEIEHANSDLPPIPVTVTSSYLVQ
jgi:prepilin-type N-terminal cleavage/methylation domain-containing protein